MTGALYLRIASDFIFLILCFAAAFFDLRRNGIPNQVTFPGIMAGAVITLVTASEPLIKLLVFLLLFLLGPYLFGEGDVKLSMMAVMLLGTRIFILSFLISQLLILLVAALTRPAETRKVLRFLFSCTNYSKQLLIPHAASFPFAPALFISCSMVLVWRWYQWIP